MKTRHAKQIRLGVKLGYVLKDAYVQGQRSLAWMIRGQSRLAHKAANRILRKDNN